MSNGLKFIIALFVICIIYPPIMGIFIGLASVLALKFIVEKVLSNFV